LTLLDQKGQFDPTNFGELRAKADQSPPENEDKKTLSSFYFNRGRAASSIGRYNQALEDLRIAYRYSNVKTHQLTRDLGVAEFICGNFKRAIELLELSIREKENPNTYAQLVKLYTRVGDLESAERVENRGVALCNGLQGRKGWGEWPMVSAAKMKAYLLEAQGKFAEAEKYYQKIQLILTPSSKRKYPIITVVNRIYLARNLKRQGRLFEAELEARQALKEVLGYEVKNTEIVGVTIIEIGEILQSQGRLQDAEKFIRTGIRMFDDLGISSDSYIMGQGRMWLGNVLSDRRYYVEAMKQYDLAKDGLRQNQYLYEKFFARNPNLILSLLKTNHTQEAITRISTIYDINSKSFGKEHYLTAEILGLRGIANAMMKKNKQALLDFSEALPVLFDRTEGDIADYSKNLRLKIIVEAYIDLLSQIHGSQLENDTGINASAEAFKFADAIRGRTVQSAVEMSGARAAAMDPALADLVRKEQDALKQVNALHTSLSNALAANQDQQNPDAFKNLKTSIGTLINARATLLDEIKRNFPKYSDFTNPQPVTLSQVKNHLRPREALISIYSTEERIYVWAIPKTGDIQFVAVSVSKKDLKKSVTRLRKALDPEPGIFGDIPAFDLDNAYKLYSKLLKPVENGWKDAKGLLVAVTGPLGQLPFSVLPTAPVKLGQEKNELFANYRKIPWLIRTASITRYPSVSSFVTLRKLPPGDAARKAFVGFGDPFFNPEQLAQANTEKISHKEVIASLGTRLNVRGIRLTQTGNLDSEKITSCHLGLLNRLPDTATEIRSIAKALDADLTRDIFLGEKASEHQVKAMDLSDRRVIAFATHALVPGDLDGLDQPAIALSSPSVTGDNEDGLLTMGEVLKLKLNADWVVLSACNTAAADGAGAEAISGLGRAFFYAGTRAILVSMWPVETTSAKKLTTKLFHYQKEDKTLSRARALQKTMLALIDDPGLKDEVSGKIIASYAHPLFWAPFIIVGEGSGTQN